MIEILLALLLYPRLDTPKEYQSLHLSPPVTSYETIDPCSLKDITCDNREESQKEENIEEIIERVCQENGFTEVEKLKRIASCESSNDPKAKNPDPNSSAMGLFQILDMHKLSVAERQDPEIATQWAIDNFKNGKPWATSEHCWR